MKCSEAYNIYIRLITWAFKIIKYYIYLYIYKCNMVIHDWLHNMRNTTTLHQVRQHRWYSQYIRKHIYTQYTYSGLMGGIERNEKSVARISSGTIILSSSSSSLCLLLTVTEYAIYIKHKHKRENFFFFKYITANFKN